MDSPWCPAGCTREASVSTALYDSVMARVSNADANAGAPLLEAHGVVNCPKCARPIEIWASREWTFDCSKGDGWSKDDATPRIGTAIPEGTTAPRTGEAST